MKTVKCAMLSSKTRIAVGLVYACLASVAFASDFGRPATPDEITLWDIDIRPDGRGLPEGSGTVAQGKLVYDDNCSGCHGNKGQGGIKDRLVGGHNSLATETPVVTVGSYWPYATTLFDYVRRAMPYPAPGSLSADETYAVVAYILSLNGIVSESAKLDKANLPEIEMPNRGGFIPEPEFRIIRNSRQQ
jgi:S-disulfanyl-L-cysteine oxidoreductase SoxD